MQKLQLHINHLPPHCICWVPHVCSRKCSLFSSHHPSWCSSVRNSNVPVVVAGPSAKSLSLINQGCNFFTGIFYECSGYQQCRGMKNGCFFFSYDNRLEGSQRSVVWDKCVVEFRKAACPDLTYNSLLLSFCPRQDSIGLGMDSFESRPPANTIFLWGEKRSSSYFFTPALL